MADPIVPQSLIDAFDRLAQATEAASAAAEARAEEDKKAAEEAGKKAKEDAKARKAEADAEKSLQKVASAGKAVAREFMSIVDAGAKLSSTLGVTLTRGTELELKNRLSLLAQIGRVEIDRMATMQQIQAVEKSFVDAIGGARQGMEISAEGATQFASRLKAAAGGEFSMTTSAMQAMITAGIGGAQGLETFKKATGLRSVSEQRFAQLVNKNSLSFMLYGPRFAKAAQEAEKLGISLAQVQSAQESMVTNLDGTIDTIAQVNQLGGQIDFGTLTQINEFQGPEATLKYLQSTIPPALFQSASTRALLKGFGISVEDLMKGQESVQKSAADKIEEQLTTLQKPIGAIAKVMAGLGAIVEKLKNSFGPLIMAVGGLGIALLGLRSVPFPLLKETFTKAFPTIAKAFQMFAGISARLLGAMTAGIFSGIAGFAAAKRSGRDNYEAAGGALVRGGLAAGGALLGAALIPVLGPLGPIIGGFIGDLLGKTLNKYFPELANSIGAFFKGFVEAFTPIKDAFSNLMSTLRELFATIFGGEQGMSKILPYMKEFGYVVGYVVLLPLNILISTLASAAGMFTALAKVLSGDFTGAIKSFRGSLASLISPFVPESVEKSIRGDDVVSRSGYGDRSLVTPNGTVSLNNRDTVVAFADDMVSGIRTMSLGSIARNFQSAPDSALVAKMNELIAVLQNSKTTINIDNKIQQIPRMAMAGVYSRNERV